MYDPDEPGDRITAWVALAGAVVMIIGVLVLLFAVVVILRGDGF